MNRDTLLNDFETAQKYALDGRQARIWTTMPAIVEAVNFEKMTVDCVISIMGTQTFSDGTTQPIQISKLTDVPIVFPAAGGFIITFPIQVGDEVLLNFASRCIDSWWQNGGLANVPMEDRMHDLSDAFAIPGPRSLPNVVSGISSENIQIRNKSGTTYLEITPAGVMNIVAPTGLNIMGEVIVTGEVIANGIPLSTHVHTGVISGPSDTGPPAP